MGDGKSWTDGFIIHGSHLVILSVTFLFPLSQLLPVLPINLQCQRSPQFAMTLSGVSPLISFGVLVGFGSLLIPPHLEMHLCSDQVSTALQRGSGISLHLTKISYAQIVADCVLFLLPLPSVAHVHSAFSVVVQIASLYE